MAISLLIYFLCLSPILYLNATQKYDKESVEPEIIGNYLSKYSISNYKNQNIPSDIPKNQYLSERYIIYDYFTFEWKQKRDSIDIVFSKKIATGTELQKQQESTDFIFYFYQITATIAQLIFFLLLIGIDYKFKKKMVELSNQRPLSNL